MDEGDRRAPIALARDAPVAQAPHRRALAPAFMLGAGDDGRLGLVDVHAVQEMTVHKAAGANIGLVAVGDLSVRVAVGNDAVKREGIFARETEVALVGSRTRESRTRH